MNVLHLCRCDNRSTEHSKNMTRSEYRSPPLERVWNANPVKRELATGSRDI